MEPQPPPPDAPSPPPPPPAPPPTAPETEGAGFDGFGDLDDEDDWQFNEDLPAFDESTSATSQPAPTPDITSEASQSGNALDAMPDLDTGSDSIELESPGLDLGRGGADLGGELDDDIDLDLSDPDPPPAPMPPTPQKRAPASNEPGPGFGGERDGGDFGSVDDFSSLMEPDEHEAAAEARAVSAQPAQSEGSEDWDFFSDSDEGGGDAFSSMMGTSSAAPGESMSSIPGLDDDSGIDEIGTSGASTRSPMPIDEEASRSLGSQVGMAAGWMITLALVFAGLSVGLESSMQKGVEAPKSVQVGAMQAIDVSGVWIDTARLGTLYAVRGQLANPGESPAAPEVMLEAVLLDSAGQPLDYPTARFGRGLSTQALREISASELQDSQRQASETLAWEPIPAGASSPLIAVFRELPDEAMRFELRVVEAGPRPIAEAPSESEAALPETGDGSETVVEDRLQETSDTPSAETAAPAAGAAAGPDSSQ